MAAAGAGPGPGAPPGLEATRQKLALRRKKVLSAEEMELYELAQAAGGAIDPDVFKILVDLLKLNVAPLAVFQMLKSMCAGQRLAGEPQDSAAVGLPAASASETRGGVYWLISWGLVRSLVSMETAVSPGGLSRPSLPRGLETGYSFWLGLSETKYCIISRMCS
nr:mitotic-spindle organizing protein 2B isoform X1 [Microcebus murinus]XP_012632092.1 mitotic-spindle organizing protein 2B isoform X1 [Microcebus murinus]